VYANNSLSNKPGGRYEYTKWKRSFAANKATKYAPNLIKKVKSCTLLFEYGKEYLSRQAKKLLLELLLMYSKILPIRESQTTRLTPPYSKHLLYTEG
jgi:hypothetical protein